MQGEQWMVVGWVILPIVAYVIGCVGIARLEWRTQKDKPSDPVDRLAELRRRQDSRRRVTGGRLAEATRLAESAGLGATLQARHR
ncbi:hypothetical protein [Janibacter sp. G1551]|uniref:hypothetical protein n=1 Tax=Janibacter sp. G1551 TaxID=3420440 RepID=UPI003D06521E